jgi:FKBP-type peptidyl-prolyl cis-trans isomerase
MLGKIAALLPVMLALSAGSGRLPQSRPPIGQVRLPILSYTVDASGAPGGAHPRRSDTVAVNYSLRLLDGTLVDSSAMRGRPDSFSLRHVIPAWEILLPRMRAGDIWTFYVPPEYAYGASSSKDIPANSFLVFKVELVSFAPTPPEEK